jgi:hypothetical protein
MRIGLVDDREEDRSGGRGRRRGEEMNQLVVNGIDLAGELPGDWTVAELMKVLETEVLYADEVIVDVRIDGLPFALAPEVEGPRLAAIDAVTVSSRRVDDVVAAAIESANATARHFAGEVARSTAALRVGRDAEGWDAQRRAMGSLRLFLDLAERLATTLLAGLGPGPGLGELVRAIAGELDERLTRVDAATTADDTVELCDALDETAAWLTTTWSGIWGIQPAPAAQGRPA